MGAKVSPEMKRARKLLAASPGTPQAEIARKVGLDRSALAHDPVCRGIIQKYKQERDDGKDNEPDA